MLRWPDTEAAEALSWYAESHGMTVYTGVPVTRPRWHGWGSNCSERLESVAVRSAGRGAVRPFEEDTFKAALSEGAPVHPVIAWGYADRPRFGHLATFQAYLARSWRPRGPIQPVALVAPGEARPNVADSYVAAGFEVLSVPGEARSKKRGGGRGLARNDPWDAPETREDLYLNALWTNRRRDGWWLAEVPVGNGSGRRIDAVVVAWPEGGHTKAGDNLDAFRQTVAAGADVELIEAKHRLNVDAVGQLLCGAHMFDESWPGRGQRSLTACVTKAGDEALNWYCGRYGIRVEVV